MGGCATGIERASTPPQLTRASDAERVCHSVSGTTDRRRSLLLRLTVVLNGAKNDLTLTLRETQVTVKPCIDKALLGPLPLRYERRPVGTSDPQPSMFYHIKLEHFVTANYPMRKIGH